MQDFLHIHSVQLLLPPEGNGALLVIARKSCYAVREVMNGMETKEIIYRLRREKGLSQDELADKVYVTRQAVSRWENGVSQS